MAGIKLDRLCALVVCFVLCVGTAWSAPNDARDDAYQEWETLSYREKMTFCTAALVAAAYGLQKVEHEYPQLRGISSWLPYRMTNAEMVQLVDMVYARYEWRYVPYITIMLEPDQWYEALGIRSVGNGK